MLRSIRDDRLLYFSNHPTTSEPPVAYYVANVMGARFQFMAARQVFEWGGGLVGKFISSIGAFSVLAGAADRESIKMSRAILSQPRGKLVLYPEGEPTSGENDNLLPFQQGAAQLGIWALEDARKSDPSADVTVLPTFVKYVMTGTEAHLRADLHQNIKIVEAKLGVDPGNRNLLRRFLAVGRVMLEKAEKDYKAKPDDAKTKEILATAYFQRAFILTDNAQYSAALGDFRKGLKLNPNDQKAKDMHDQIVSIYQSMGREVPKEGEEKAPVTNDKK